MSGYGSPDDEQERATLTVEERVALARSMLPSGPGTSHCVECGESIPEARRKAMKGVRHCVDCQEERDHNLPTFKQPWAT
jgi:phage/conjugal plasmid C-4 type zinc finger TraR family protein